LVVVGPVVVDVVGSVVVVVVGSVVVVVVGSVVVVVVVPPDAGRRAIVAADGALPETTGAQVLAASLPAWTFAWVATATCEFPELLTVPPREEPSGA
jgi:hypothetical protein